MATTKKFAKYIEKQLKNIINISPEPIFGNFILNKNGKRIGVLFDNQLYLIATENLKKLLPNATEENPFGWAYYRLIHIEDTENTAILEELVEATYNDLYFSKSFVADISYLIQSWRAYPKMMVETYDLHIPFLQICYENKLIKFNPLDDNNRIIKMNFTNNDLTEKGTKIFRELYDKWLKYNDKRDEKRFQRMQNTKMLEKYYSKILEETQE